MAPPRDVVHDTLPRLLAAGQYLTRCGLSPAPLLKGHGSTPSLQFLIDVGHRQKAVSVPHAQSYLTSAFLTYLSRKSALAYLPPHIYPPHISRSLARSFKKKSLTAEGREPEGNAQDSPSAQLQAQTAPTARRSGDADDANLARALTTCAALQPEQMEVLPRVC